MNPPIRGECGQSARHRIAHHLTRNLLALLGLLIGPIEGALAFGPFPPGTTVFVDAANTSGSENGTAAHPFDRIGEAINAAPAGAVVGVAPGVYDENPDITKPLQLSATTLQLRRFRTWIVQRRSSSCPGQVRPGCRRRTPAPAHAHPTSPAASVSRSLPRRCRRSSRAPPRKSALHGSRRYADQRSRRFGRRNR
jgi:Protein of unknown function (DUF1565)